jgi:hypothetical protein
MELSLFTSALRRAILWLPTARVKVTVGIRPSGTSATIIPMANSRLNHNDRPINNPSTKKTVPSPRAIYEMVLETLAISFSRGLNNLVTRYHILFYHQPAHQK